jgi:predicted alpha/beta-hydrolase family hydrolase
VKATRRLKGLLLFPGAGSDSSQPSLVRLESSLAPLPVRRADFPYRIAGRRAPDRSPVLVDTVRSEATAFAAELRSKTASLALGGRSMGGRMCSLAVAGGVLPGTTDDAPALPAAGLVLICYPLHPPGKPENLRVEHLPRLTVPCLFISGTRDPFGTPDELLRWTETIPAPVTHVWLEGKGHDLKGADAAIAEAVGAWLPEIASGAVTG